MATLIAFLSTSLGKYIAGAGVALVAALGWGIKQRLAGRADERAAQAAAEAGARDIKDQVQNDIGALPVSKAREELKTWSKC